MRVQAVDVDAIGGLGRTGGLGIGPARVLQAFCDATVLVEAERIEDAFDLYERGADYVIVSTVLSREMIDEHLRQYLTDHEAFMDVRNRDIGHMLWRVGDD